MVGIRKIRTGSRIRISRNGLGFHHSISAALRFGGTATGAHTLGEDDLLKN